MEDTDETPKSDVKPKFFTRKLGIRLCIFLLAVIFGLAHYWYVWTLHENDTNFSHLSQLEREMSLRTEMGFYYSYYKTVVEERPFLAAISKLMYDRLVEYPNEVNALNRFNIYPEVITGALYRYAEPWLNTSAHRECHIVDRGEGLSPVESCVGLGEPVMFYLQAVWVLAGLTVAAVFLHAVTLSETILGGILAVVQYFANHSEATRVQWSPNERENFAVPLLLVQAWMISVQLRQGGQTSFRLQVSIFFLNCLCLLFWQFTQFIFLTQTAIFFTMEQMKIIDLKTLCIFLHSHFCGLHMAVFLMQGNDMLKSSLYTSLFIVVSAYCLFFSSLRVKVESRMELFTELWLIFLRISIVVCASFYFKKLICDFLDLEEDSHIWDLLYSKFTDYKTFHTLIYTCCDVFHYLPLSSYINLCKTLLLPIVLICSLNVTVFWTREGLKKTTKPSKTPSISDPKNYDDADDSGIENSEVSRKKVELRPHLDAIEDKLKGDKKEIDSWVRFLSNLKVDAAIFYNISQMVVFGVMAALVMRLKLLFVGQMCIVSSLVVNTKYYSNPKSTYIPLIWGVCAAVIGHYMYTNMSAELSIMGEYKNIELEQMLTWISSATGRGAAFAGSMPTLAAVLLAARRPVVAHPHYEHKDTRERVYSIYKVYGRFSAEEVYEELNKMKVTYLIVSAHECYGAGRRGEFAPGFPCTYGAIWDYLSPSSNARLCARLLRRGASHLYRVFQNERYQVFRLHDLSVRYMPRSFDT